MTLEYTWPRRHNISDEALRSHIDSASTRVRVVLSHGQPIHMCEVVIHNWIIIQRLLRINDNKQMSIQLNRSQVLGRNHHLVYSQSPINSYSPNMVVNFKVFKKSSPNGKIMLYLGKRDFVDHISGVEPIGKASSLVFFR